MAVGYITSSTGCDSASPLCSNITSVFYNENFMVAWICLSLAHKFDLGLRVLMASTISSVYELPARPTTSVWPEICVPDSRNPAKCSSFQMASSEKALHDEFSHSWCSFRSERTKVSIWLPPAGWLDFGYQSGTVRLDLDSKSTTGGLPSTQPCAHRYQWQGSGPSAQNV